MDLIRDVRHGCRQLLRAPAFAITAILTLSLGIGATTALFTVVNAVLLEPLPFPDSAKLVRLWRSELPALTNGSASYARFRDWRAQQRAFTDLGAWSARSMTVTGDNGAERLPGAVASASFFKVVGRTPVAGRFFSDYEDSPGGEKVVVISESLAARYFQAASGALGRTLTIEGQPHTVIGVAPSEMAEVWSVDTWLALGPQPDSGSRANSYLACIGRLRDGVTLDAARAAMSDLAADMSRQFAADRYTFTLRPLHEVATQNASRGLWMVLGAAGVLLLIACTNVANLLLARAVTHERDLAVRASLGAGRSRLFGQVMGETLALSAAGSLIAAGLVWVLLRLFTAFAPLNFPRLSAISVNERVLSFSFILAMITGLLAGLPPFIHLFRTDLTSVIRAAGTRSITAGAARRASRVLVVAEVTLALALVMTGGLMVKSLMRLQSEDLGLTREPVLTFGVSLPQVVANGNEAVRQFQIGFINKLRELPGVTSSSAISLLPIAASGNNGPVRRLDQTDPNDGVPVTEFRIVMDRYFETMGVPLLYGRSLDQRDTANSAPVAVVNENLAKRLFPKLAPSAVVGQQLALFGITNQPAEVVGVVRDVRSRRPDAPPDPEMYLPFAQYPSPTMAYVIRANGNPSSLAAPLRTAMAEMSPHVALSTLRMFDEIVATSTRTTGLLSWLSVSFGVLASLLAIVGIFGVTSYTVAQRERELAIRAALGATRKSLLVMMVREGAQLGGIGIVLGALLTFASSSLLRSLLYQVSPTDSTVFAASAVGLAVVVIAGCAWPASKASRVEPVEALRSE